MDITNHPASDVIHVCNRSQESRIVAFMFTKRQLDGWRGYWDLSTSGNSCIEFSRGRRVHNLRNGQSRVDQRENASSACTAEHKDALTYFLCREGSILVCDVRHRNKSVRRKALFGK